MSTSNFRPGGILATHGLLGDCSEIIPTANETLHFLLDARENDLELPFNEEARQHALTVICGGFLGKTLDELDEMWNIKDDTAQDDFWAKVTHYAKIFQAMHRSARLEEPDAIP